MLKQVLWRNYNTCLLYTSTGSGSAEFYSRFDAIIGKCEEVLNVVNTYALTLSEAADVYSANEKKISSSAGKLKINLK